MPSSAAFQALQAEGVALAKVLRSVPTADLRLATRCMPWTLHTLGGHVIRGLERTVSMLEKPSGQPADENRLVYYQSPLRSDPRRSLARNEGADRAAARFTAGGEIATALDDAVDAIDTEIARVGTQVNVETHWGPIMALEDYLVTRVVELVVHGIDIADCLGQPTWMTVEAADVVKVLIDELVGQPIEPGWLAESLIRAATGRQPLSRAQEMALGVDASRFPLFT